jgi:hypothetical protein
LKHSKQYHHDHHHLNASHDEIKKTEHDSMEKNEIYTIMECISFLTIMLVDDHIHTKHTNKMYDQILQQKIRHVIILLMEYMIWRRSSSASSASASYSREEHTHKSLSKSFFQTWTKSIFPWQALQQHYDHYHHHSHDNNSNKTKKRTNENQWLCYPTLIRQIPTIKHHQHYHLLPSKLNNNLNINYNKSTNTFLSLLRWKLYMSLHALELCLISSSSLSSQNNVNENDDNDRPIVPNEDDLLSTEQYIQNELLSNSSSTTTDNHNNIDNSSLLLLSPFSSPLSSPDQQCHHHALKSKDMPGVVPAPILHHDNTHYHHYQGKSDTVNESQENNKYENLKEGADDDNDDNDEGIHGIIMSLVAWQMLYQHKEFYFFHHPIRGSAIIQCICQTYYTSLALLSNHHDPNNDDSINHSNNNHNHTEVSQSSSFVWMKPKHSMILLRVFDIIMTIYIPHLLRIISKLSYNNIQLQKADYTLRILEQYHKAYRPMIQRHAAAAEKRENEKKQDEPHRHSTTTTTSSLPKTTNLTSKRLSSSLKQTNLHCHFSLS